MIGALHASRGLPRRLDRGQEQGHEQANDGDDHEDFDQREACGRAVSKRSGS
jgi:hypothetical protein